MNDPLKNSKDSVKLVNKFYAANQKVIISKWNLKLDNFAELIKTKASRATLSHWSSGRNLPSYSDMLNIIRMTGLPLERLVSTYITPEDLPDKPFDKNTSVVKNDSENYFDIRVMAERIKELEKKADKYDEMMELLEKLTMKFGEMTEVTKVLDIEREE